jgi:SAM-dependent methyltransferase
MGLDYRTLHLLATEVFKTYRPKSCVCLGRPHYFGVNKETLRLCQEFELEPKPELLAGSYRQRFADSILKAFGIERLDHMDVFRDEGATIIQDLNLPIPDTLRNQFDVVLDNGTLEHVFNIPQALENCAALCAINGHVVIIAPANNYCGHGFFQFSPELFYRTFCESNGFSETKVHLLEYGVRGRNIALVDPAVRKSRLEFINSSQVVMVGVARKTRDKRPFWTQWPQQSDYVVYWNTAESRKGLEHQAPGFEVFLLNNFPRLSRFLQGLKFSSLNPKMRLRSNR